MSASSRGLDFSEIQKLIVKAYPKAQVRHFVLRISDGEKGRVFLERLLQKGWITAASIADESLKTEPCLLNIGFTYRGLEQLRLPRSHLNVFHEKARAFVESAYLRAARRLADYGNSAAEHWQESFKLNFAHVLVSIYADDNRILTQRTADLKLLSHDCGLDGWDAPLDGCRLPGNRGEVHFGFRDGVSKVSIADIPPGSGGHQPGEFLLGYANDAKFNPWLLATRPDLADFFRNGSFAAFRKIEQHEAQFRDYVNTWSIRLNVSREYVMAKLCGRWPNGMVMTKDSPSSAPAVWRKTSGDEDLDKIDDFDFSDDPRGVGCPFGAHIRRMNPRSDPVVPFRTRPLIRRGIPYGPAFGRGTENAERGLLGLFFCASLEDQFEHLLAEWGDKNPLGPPSKGNATDPLAGNHGDLNAVFDIPGADGKSQQLTGFTQFTRTRGTLYAFYPSISALKQIAKPDAEPQAALEPPAWSNPACNFGLVAPRHDGGGRR